MSDEFDDALDTAKTQHGGNKCRTCQYGASHEVTLRIAKWVERTENGTTQMSRADLHRWLLKVGFEGKASALQRHLRECLKI